MVNYVAATALLLAVSTTTSAFVPTPRSLWVTPAAASGARSDPSPALMAVASKKKGKKKAPPKKAGGFGAKTESVAAAAPKTDIKILMSQSEAKYAELEAIVKEMELSEKDDLDFQFREFVVAMRAKPGTADAKQLSDWVPAASVATLTQSSEEASETFLTDAVSSVAREVFGCMCNSIPSVKSISPSSIEYAVESIDSFEKHVYVLVDNSDRKRDKQTLSKADAWKTLGLDPETAEASDIKKTYRKLCMKYHPDSNPDDEEAEAKYQEVQDAYNRLSGDVSGEGNLSWYESIGVNDGRNSFYGPLSLESIGKERELHTREVKDGGRRVACIMLDSELTQFFASRNVLAN